MDEVKHGASVEPKHDPRPLTVRERIVFRLVLFLIQLLKPYQYEHQFKPWMEDMRALVDSDKGESLWI